MSFKDETKSIVINNEEILIKRVYLSNAVIIFITEKPAALGTICLAAPTTDQEGVRRGESLSILGGKFDFVAKAIAERLTIDTGKIVMVSVALSEKFLENQSMLSKIIGTIREIDIKSGNIKSII